MFGYDFAEVVARVDEKDYGDFLAMRSDIGLSLWLCSTISDGFVELVSGFGDV